MDGLLTDMNPRAFAWIGTMIVLAIGGCGGPTSTTFEIGNRTFRVPAKYLIQQEIPWLPQSKSDSLMFHINPEASPEERNIVTIESRQTKCESMADASSELRQRCDGADIGANQAGLLKVRKVIRDGDPTQWSYIFEAADGKVSTVASCFAMADGVHGLCTALGSYKGMIFSLGLSDDEVENLPDLKRHAIELLSSWDVTKYVK